MSLKSGLSRRWFLKGAAGVAAAAAMRPHRAAAEGKVLRVRFYSDIQVLDPAFRLSQNEDDIFQPCLVSLVTRKTGDVWDWELQAAESIEQVDDTHIKFKLKPGITWSNGFGELTAEDVKYSFERVADFAKTALGKEGDAENQSPYKDDWALLDHVEVTDKHNGVIVLKEFFAPLWTSTLPEGSCAIVCKAAVEKLPDKKFTVDIPAVSGPYMVKEWVQKQRTVLARNPEWKGEAPYYDEIHVLPIEDEKVAETGYEAGELDFTRVSLATSARYHKEPPKDSQLIERPSLKYVWLGMNVEHPLFQDVKVRRAVQQALDVDSMIDAAYFGQAARATGIVAPGLVGHREKSAVSYDPAAAKKALADAGKADGFKTKISTLNKEEYLAAVQVIQANLGEIGIEAVIDTHDSGTFWTLGDEKSGDTWKDLQLIYQRFSMNPDPSYATAWFTSDQVGVWNWQRWRSPEFDDLHKKALVERDPAKRDEMYKRMQDLMEDSGAFVFITHEANALVYRNGVAPALKPDGNAILQKFKSA
jgi:peptide/nickel transport system substrate-binding protein